MTKNTKTATFKTFEAARLTTGKYAGIPKGERAEFLPDVSQEYEKFVTAKSYGSGARKFAALTVSQVSASGLEYMGFFAVPEGLKAAAKMARRVSGEFSGSLFSFGFDAAGRWSYEFDDPEGMASTDGSAEDLGEGGAASFASSMREMPAVVWALASFDAVQLWKNEKGFFFFAVGNVDDGRVLLLNSGMEGDFFDPSEVTEDPTAEIVKAVSAYPAEPVAACEAPKAENFDAEGENARGGAEVRPEAENGFFVKMQINTLNNGCIDAIKCGTNRDEREAIAAKVFAENPESITLTCNGITKTLTKGSSKSGLTSWYECEVTEKEVNILEGVRIDCRRFGHESSFSLFLLGDCRICIEKSTRKSPAAQWKFRGYDYLQESLFTVE